MAKEKQIGKISHFFNKIDVAVIELTKPLKVGETIHIVGGERDFNQTVSSMQIDRQDIDKAKAGQDVGLKVDQAVREGDKVYKVEE